MKFINKINSLIQNIGKEVSGLSILLMMFIIVADVITRNIFNYSIPGTYAFIENFLMPLSVFPALGYVYMSEVLPRLGEFIERRSTIIQKVHNILMLVIDLFVFILLTYFTFSFFLNGFQAQLTIPVSQWNIPIWPVYLIVPIGYFLVLQEVIIQLINYISKMVKHSKVQ